MLPEEMEQLVRERIAARRKRLKLNQSELARRLQCSPAYVNQVESGERSLGVGTLAKFADALETTASKLTAERSHADKLAIA